MVEQLGAGNRERVVFFLDAEHVVHAAGQIGCRQRAGCCERIAVGHVVVLDHIIEVFRPLVGIQRFVTRDGAGGNTPIALETDRSGTFRTTFGGHDHHAVGATGAVQGAGGGVLDDGHRLDVVGVQCVDVTVVRHAVHHVERGGVGVEGTETTDAHGCAGTRLSGTGGRLDTGCQAVEGFRHVGDGTFLNLLGLDGLGRTRKGLFLRGTIGDHEHVLQEFGIGCQDDVDDRTALDGHFLCLIADGAENERRARRNRQDICTVRIGRGTCHGTFQLDGGEGNAFSGIRVDDFAFYLDILGERHSGYRKQKTGQNESDFLHRIGF